MAGIGDKITDFVLKDQFNHDVKSADFRGKKILLSFHPLAFTPVCTNQMKSLEANVGKFKELNTVAFGMSIDHQFAKAAWAKEIGVEHTKLLADFWPTGAVAKSLDIFRNQNGFSQRANIILDENGVVIFAKIYDIPELPDIEEIISFLVEQNA